MPAKASSTPQNGNMPDSHFGVIVGQQTRRLACDRCHYQKLRCTQNENYDSCERCLKSRRECVWSPPLKIGRPTLNSIEERSKNNTAPPKSRKRQRPEKSTKSIDSGRSQGSRNPDSLSHQSSPALSQSMPMSRHQSTTTMNSDYGAVSPTSLFPLPAWLIEDGNEQEISHAMNLNQANNNVNMECFDAFDFSEQLNFLDIFSPVAEPTNFAFNPNMPTSAPMNTGIKSPLVDRNGWEDTFMGSNNASPFGMSPPASLKHESGANFPWEDLVMASNYHQQPIPDPIMANEASRARTPPLSSSLDPVEDCIRQLSSLNTSIYKLNEAIIASPFAEMFLTPFSAMTVIGRSTRNPPLASGPTKYPIGEIFQISEKLLSLVQHFFVSGASVNTNLSIPDGTDMQRAASNTHSSSISSRRSSLGSVTSSMSGYNRHSSGTDTPATSASLSSFLTMRSTATSFSGPSPSAAPLVRPDLPLALMLTTCYIRLLRLYNTMFTHIYHFTLGVHSVSAIGLCEATLLIPPFFQFGSDSESLSPATGTAQTDLIVQVSCHLLGQIEKLLGIEQWEKSGLTISENDANYPQNTPTMNNRELASGNSSVSSNNGDSSHEKRKRHERTFSSDSGDWHTNGGNGAGLGEVLHALLTPELMDSIMKAEGLATACEEGQPGGLHSLRKMIRKVKRLLRKGNGN